MVVNIKDEARRKLIMGIDTRAEARVRAYMNIERMLGQANVTPLELELARTRIEELKAESDTDTALLLSQRIPRRNPSHRHTARQ